MSCHHIEADLVDLARGAEPDTPEAARLREHLGQCQACAARFEREQRLTAGLRDLAACGPRPEQSAALEQRLLEAFAARQTTEPRLPSRSRVASTAWRRWLAAAAVLVMAVAGWLGYARWRGAGEDAPVPARADGGPAGGDAAPADEQLRFVALPSAAGLPSLESGRIVRVDVPLAVMPAHGFVIAPEDMDRVVEADVLVGQDGQPRAIRFVNAELNRDSEPGRRP